MLNWYKDTPADVIDPIMAFRLEIVARSGVTEQWWSAILELEDLSLKDLLENARNAGLEGTVIIPNLYSDEDRDREEIQYPTVYATSAFLNAANIRDNPLGVKRLLCGTIVPDAVLDFGAGRWPAALPNILVPDGSVVTAVIDNGIAFAHELFRKTDPTKSRVAFAWIMDADPSASAGTVPVSQGRALANDEIDMLLANNTAAGLLDEDTFYHQAGLIDFAWPGVKQAALRVSHGTHVMGLAAGSEPGTVDDTNPIICVQLPTDVTMDVSGADLLPSLALATVFIKKMAKRFRYQSDPGKRVPLVVNFSYGNFAGPHDGTGIVEKMLDRKFRPLPNRERQLALPAGNGNLARSHARVRLEPPGDEGDEVELHWRLPPDDLTASYVEIWMPCVEDPDNLVEVTVEPAGGPESDPVTTTAGSMQVLETDQNLVVGRLWYAFQPSPTDRGLITVSAAPTFSHDNPADVAPSGVWKIRIRNLNLTPVDSVEVWVRRDETLPGFPRFGRQSYFDNDCYDRFNAFGAPLPIDPPGSTCVVRRAGTLSGFACGERPAVLAGFVESSGELAIYSAAGPITTACGASHPTRTGPDAAAVSDDTRVLHGILSAGSRNGSLVALNGTSVAAPQAARWMAGRLAGGLSGNRVAVNAKGAADDPGFVPPPKPALPRVGGGRMDRIVRFGPNRKA
ncbi:S8 family serine peptidase [Stappia sp. GBMRC 2046]|uniref:S8 family serine peptidase n=1 Tax=Stappia sediminis TaxID=2692190 RepID=A0A7X3S7L3_9HYPH|nr:S8 family serine peptidase [Stappia sediminis]MXN64906.1 S8 family serine peptidase [Stappia sediminis]